MEISLLLLALLVIILGFLWIRQRDARGLPPGPWGIPFLGYLPFLGQCAHETFMELSEKYGNIFSVVLGSQTVVVLNDWAAVKAALADQARIFSGRPEMFLFDSVVKKRDISTKHGPIWKAQRKFTIHALKLVGPMHDDKESCYMDSVNELIEKFEGQSGNVIRFEDDIFFDPIFNIVRNMVCKKTVDEDNKDVSHFYKIVKENIYGFRNNSPVNFVPFLRYLVPGGFGYWTYVKHHDMLWSYLEEEIKGHQRTFSDGECRDFLDIYIEEIRKREQLNGKAEPPFTTENLAGTLYDLLLAGTDTSANTLTWAVQILSTWTLIQDKVHDELDAVVGRGRVPVIQDRPMLPYLEAVTLEIHRYASIIPLSLLHSPLKDAVVLGHKIPEGCTVIQNIYGVHRDPKCWEKPYEFRPERFLDSENRVVKPACLIPFSLGARVCLGESLARNMIFLFLACVLQKVSFRLAPNMPPPSWNPIVGLSLSPKQFHVVVSTR